MGGCGIECSNLNLLFIQLKKKCMKFRLFLMAMAGVALATVLSQVVSAGLVIRCLVLSDGSIKLDLKKGDI